MHISLNGLVEVKTLAIFMTLLKNPTKLYHINSLANSAKIPITSTARIIKKLVKSEFVQEMKIGKISVYKLADNKKNEAIKKL